MGRRKGQSITRDQVVDVALALVRTEGADALVLSRVARELGIKPPSIYAHVGRGDALARAVVLRANRELLEAFKTAVRTVEAPDAQLRALAHATRRWARENGGLYVLMARVEPDNDHPDFTPIVRDLLDLFSRPLRRLGVPDDAQVHAIRSLRSAVHGFVLLESSGQFQMRDAPDESFDWLVEMVIRGAAT